MVDSATGWGATVVVAATVVDVVTAVVGGGVAGPLEAVGDDDELQAVSSAASAARPAADRCRVAVIADPFSAVWCGNRGDRSPPIPVEQL